MSPALTDGTLAQMSLGNRPSLRADASRWRLPTRAAVVATLVTWLPMAAWYLALRPGLMSNDSLVVWRQATHGHWVDFHPPLYTAAMWLSSVVVGGPDLVTLGQSLLLAASMVAVARAVIRLGAPVAGAGAVLAVMAVSPMVGAFAVSLWKDVPYTAAVLFVAARVLDIVSSRVTAAGVDRSVFASLATWLVAASVLRQNGVVFVAVVLVVLALALPTARRFALVAATSVAAVLLLTKFVVYPATGVGTTPKQAALTLFLHDIAAVSRSDPEVFDAKDRALLAAVAPIEEWVGRSANHGCQSANWELDMPWTAVEQRPGAYFGLWADILESRPRRVVANRLCMASVAWRPIDRRAVYTVSTGVDPNSEGLRTRPVVPRLRSPAVGIIDWMNSSSVQWLLWRGPLWIYVGDMAIITAVLRRRRPVLLLAGLPAVALQLSVFPLAPAQDARYMFGGVLLGGLLLPLLAVRGRRASVEDDRPSDLGAAHEGGGPHRTGRHVLRKHRDEVAPPVDPEGDRAERDGQGGKTEHGDRGAVASPRHGQPSDNEEGTDEQQRTMDS